MGSLLAELPDTAFPAEDRAEVLLEMLIGSVHPAARAAGGHDCCLATALVGAIRERVLTTSAPPPSSRGAPMRAFRLWRRMLRLHRAGADRIHPWPTTKKS